MPEVNNTSLRQTNAYWDNSVNFNNHYHQNNTSFGLDNYPPQDIVDLSTNEQPTEKKKSNWLTYAVIGTLAIGGALVARRSDWLKNLLKKEATEVEKELGNKGSEIVENIEEGGKKKIPSIYDGKKINTEKGPKNPSGQNVKTYTSMGETANQLKEMNMQVTNDVKATYTNMKDTLFRNSKYKNSIDGKINRRQLETALNMDPDELSKLLTEQGVTGEKQAAMLESVHSMNTRINKLVGNDGMKKTDAQKQVLDEVEKLNNKFSKTEKARKNVEAGAKYTDPNLLLKEPQEDSVHKKIVRGYIELCRKTSA